MFCAGFVADSCWKRIPLRFVSLCGCVVRYCYFCSPCLSDSLRCFVSSGKVPEKRHFGFLWSMQPQRVFD